MAPQFDKSRGSQQNALVVSHRRQQGSLAAQVFIVPHLPVVLTLAVLKCWNGRIFSCGVSIISNYALCNIEVVYEQIVMLHSYNSIIIEVQSGMAA